MSEQSLLRRMMVVCAVIVAVASWASAQAVWYVDDDAPVDGDGSSWASAYQFLRDALLAASPGDEVRVGQGTYYPDRDMKFPNGSGDRNATFNLWGAIAVMGGYAGVGAPDPDLRDIAVYRTILSGAINSESPLDNSYHVVTCVEAAAVLDGCTVSDGYTENTGRGAADGAGVTIAYASPILRDCVIENNTTAAGIADPFFVWASGGNGAGVFCEEASPVLINCTICNNRTGEGGWAICTAGVPNAATEGGDGGGLCFVNSTPTLINCLIVDNYTGNGGGGVVCGAEPPTCVGGSRAGHGAGMYLSSCPDVVLRNCVIAGNVAGDGGPGVSDQFAECAGGDGGSGGGIYSASSSVFLRNCTILGNEAGLADPEPPGGVPGGGGGIYARGATGDLVDLQSCILWANQSSAGSVQQAQLDVDQVAVNYCCVEGWTGNLGGTGNIGDDPLFVAGDFHLTGTSPCLNAGDPAFQPAPDETDIDGEPRVVNGRVEMGADELLFEDCNDNQIPDELDIAAGTSADCNDNGVPDECDIADGTSADINDNEIPDECEADCNDNQIPDSVDIAEGLSADCNDNGVPDECDIADGTSADCDADGVPDECESDSDGDGVIDDCDNCPEVANAEQADSDGDGVGDACEEEPGREQPEASCFMRCLIYLLTGEGQDLGDCDCTQDLDEMLAWWGGELSDLELPSDELPADGADDAGQAAPPVAGGCLCPAVTALMVCLTLVGMCQARRRPRRRAT